MPLVLDGTNGVSGVDGTASNPSLEGTDSNTGIFYPAADTVAIGTGGTERLRVDNAGNLGLGVTPSAWGAGQTALQFAAGYVSTAGTTTNMRFGQNEGPATIYKNNGAASRYEQASGAHIWFNAPSGTAGNAITFTQAMTLDASGNLGIGTSSPRSKFDVTDGTANTAGDTTGSSIITGAAPNYGVAGGSTLVIQSNDAMAADKGGGIAFGFRATSASTAGTNSAAITGAKENGTSGNSAGYLAFYTRPNGGGITERARIDASGKLLVGSTNSAGGIFKAQPASNICISVENATSVAGSLTLSAINDAATANIPLDFRASAIYASNGIGTTASAANAFFNSGASNQFLRSTSALKYKTNIRDLEIIDVNKFRPVRYNSLCEADDPNKEHFGIIADEVDAAGIKELVTYGEDNEIEGFQYERLTVVLLKAIQELKAELDATKAKVAALENA